MTVRTFKGEDAGPAVAELLDALPARPRLLGLGEPTHFVETFLDVRNAVFRHLVEHQGYRTIAIESDCLAGRMVDAYVADGTGSLDEVLRRGFSHRFGECAGNRDLVAWMRDENRDRDPADRLRFFGFDAPTEMMSAPSPRQSMLALHGYLAAYVDPGLLPSAETIERLAGADEPWANEAAAMDPSQSVGSDPEVTTLRVLADDLRAMLLAERPGLVRATSYEAWWEADLHGRCAAGLLRYHAAMADDSPARWQWLTRLREVMMTENLIAIAGYRTPVLAFAHNRHLQNQVGHMQLGPHAIEWWGAGASAAAAGYAYVAIAAAETFRVDRAPDGTLEAGLAGLADGRFVVDAEDLAALAGAVPWTGIPMDRGYLPLEPEQVGSTDGVVFIDRAER
jgi:erythromycin esterase-like protein